VTCALFGPLGDLVFGFRVLFSWHFVHFLMYSSSSLSCSAIASVPLLPHMFYSYHDDRRGSNRDFRVKFWVSFHDLFHSIPPFL
jgi:hypothetical protein